MREQKGFTPLHHTIFRSYYRKRVEVLIKHGADIGAKTKVRKFTDRLSQHTTKLNPSFHLL